MMPCFVTGLTGAQVDSAAGDAADIVCEATRIGRSHALSKTVGGVRHFMNMAAQRTLVCVASVEAGMCLRRNNFAVGVPSASQKLTADWQRL